MNSELRNLIDQYRGVTPTDKELDAILDKISSLDLTVAEQTEAAEYMEKVFTTPKKTGHWVTVALVVIVVVSLFIAYFVRQTRERILSELDSFINRTECLIEEISSSTARDRTAPTKDELMSAVQLLKEDAENLKSKVKSNTVSYTQSELRRLGDELQIVEENEKKVIEQINRQAELRAQEKAKKQKTEVDTRKKIDSMMFHVSAPNFSGQVANGGKANYDTFILSQNSELGASNVSDVSEWRTKNALENNSEFKQIYYYYKDNELFDEPFYNSFSDLEIKFYEKYDGLYYLVYYGPIKNNVAAWEATHILVYDLSFNLMHALDLSSFTSLPRVKPEDEEFVQVGVNHAYINNDVIYFQFGHSTYASSSYGKNAYLSAVSLEDGHIIWTTPPLTCGSDFCVVDNTIICGYGFTAEPDYIYLVDKATGKRRKSYKVKTAPEHFAVKDEHLYVLTYDTEYVFNIVR